MQGTKTFTHQPRTEVLGFVAAYLQHLEQIVESAFIGSVGFTTHLCIKLRALP